MQSNKPGALYKTLYWAGMILAVACLSLALARNSALAGPWEDTPVPLSWIAGGLALLAFLGAEYFGGDGKVRAKKRAVAEGEGLAEAAATQVALQQEV